MGTTWNSISTSAAGVTSASMKRVFSFIRRRLASRAPQPRLGGGDLPPGHRVETSNSGRNESLVARRGALNFLDVLGQHLRYVLALAGKRRDCHVRICLVHGRPFGEIVRRMCDRR